MSARSRAFRRPLRTCRVLLRAALIGLLAAAVAPVASARAQTLSFGAQPILGPGDVATFGGSVAGIPAGQESDYRVFVQGVSGTLQASGAGFTFQVEVPVGPDPGAGFDSGFPYEAFYLEPNRVVLPIVAELYRISTDTVVDRFKGFVRDLRLDGGTSFAALALLRERLAMQVTSRGIDRLEPTLIAALPHPSRAAFNARLDALYTARHQELETPTGYFGADKVCLPLEEVEDLFAGTETFTNLKLLAGVQYLAYQYAKSQGLPGAPFCVKDKSFAKAKHWEVCVGRLEGDLTSVRVKGSPTKAALRPTSSGLDLAVTFGNVEQRVDVELRDVSIRWRDNPLCVTTRPSGSIADDVLVEDAARAAWASCAGTNAAAKKIRSEDPFPLTLSPDQQSRELFRTRDGGPASFSVPEGARTPRGGVGTCAQPFVAWAVEDLLRQYYEPLENAFRAAWFEGTPSSPFAVATDLLLSPLEQGTFDEDLDHDIVTDVTSIGGLVVGASEPVDGLWLRASTDARVEQDAALVPPPAIFVLPPAGPPFWSDDGLSDHLVPVPFDVAFSTTTGALNQVLRELSATERMRFVIPPGIGGVTFGQVLAAVDPTALAALASPTVEWRVSPQVAPFTWMLDDPQGPILPGRVPVAYHLVNLVIEGVEPGVGDAPDTPLLQLLVDVHDPNLGLELSGTIGDEFLVPSLSQPLLAATVGRNDLGTCPMTVHDKDGSVSCERDLERVASLALRPLVLAMMEDLLSDYPAPSFFDARGETLAPFQVEHVDVHQQDNRITLYGDFPS